jgi:cytochrome c oxidase subunit 2
MQGGRGVRFREVFERIFTLQLAIAVGVFVLITGVVLVAIVRNRARRRTALPFATTENNALEVGVAVLLGGAAAFLVWLSVQGNEQLTGGAGAPADLAAPPAARIDVTGYRWCWDFAYTDTPIRVTGTCDNPGNRPVIVVPAGQPVAFSITSQDVVHSFWVPEFGVKRDAYPDHVNMLTMSFPEGRWLGRCSEFCGTHHVDMDFYVRAVSPGEYQQWLQSGGAAA